MEEPLKSSGIFQHYEKEVENLIAELKVQVDRAYSSLVSLEERKARLCFLDCRKSKLIIISEQASLRNAERLLDGASQSLNSLELEAYSETLETKKQDNVQRVSSLKKQLERLRKVGAIIVCSSFLLPMFLGLQRRQDYFVRRTGQVRAQRFVKGS